MSKFMRIYKIFKFNFPKKTKFLQRKLDLQSYIYIFFTLLLKIMHKYFHFPFQILLEFDDSKPYIFVDLRDLSEAQGMRHVQTGVIFSEKKSCPVSLY